MRNNGCIVLTGILALGLAAGGCSKKKETAASGNNTPAPETANQAAPAPEAAPAPPPAINSQPSRTLSESDAPYQVKDLQLSVDAYEKIYKRKPASIEQMVQERFLATIPPAPPGKRYAIDASTAKVIVVAQ